MAKEMVTVYVAVLDYCAGCVKMYTIERRKGYQTDEVESWLVSNTDYKNTMCYFMCSENEIEITYPDVPDNDEE